MRFSSPILLNPIGKISLSLSSATFAIGACLLHPGLAQAAGWTPNGPPTTGYLCALNDLACFNPAAPVDSPVLLDKFVTLLDRSTTVGVNTDVMEFSLDSTDFNTPWHLTLDFNPNRGINLDDNGFLKYKITITDPSRYFDQVKLSNTSTITNGLYTLATSFWDPAYTTQSLTTILNNPPQSRWNLGKQFECPNLICQGGLECTSHL